MAGLYSAIIWILLATCLACTQRAAANDAEAADSTDAVEELVVTGSRLKRRDFQAPSPITTLEDDVMSFSGQATLEEVLNQMPQLTPDFGRVANNPGDGTARLNLRGLGAGRTLVLLNGRRLAPSGTGSSVDVNNLPQALIDRVEIITGGAATVYGSDAIAGVINFITRDEYDGVSLAASAYTTESGDSSIIDLNASYGHNFANGRGNITLFAGHYDRSPSYAGDRQFSATPWIDAGEDKLLQGGSLTAPSGVLVYVPQADLGMSAALATFNEDGNVRDFNTPDDLYNYAPANYLQTPLERTTAGLMFHYEMTERVESYVELTYAKNSARQNLAPVPAVGSFAINLDNPTLTTATRQFFNDNLFTTEPGIADMTFQRRLQELGPRVIDNHSDYLRVVGGLRGDINADWDFDLWATYTRGDETTNYLNDASRSRLQQGLLVDPLSGECFDTSNSCVPLTVFGSQSLTSEQADFIRLPKLQNFTTREQRLVSGYVRGMPFETWAGAVNLALGAQWRSDSGRFNADEALFSGDTLGFRGDSSVSGSDYVAEVYAEAMIPLLRDKRFAENIAIEIGGRHSQYGIAGIINTYKFGGEWQPLPSLRFRSMFQSSVRAPNLTEVFQAPYSEPGAFAYSSSDDPCSASADPVGRGNVEKCVAQGIPRDQIGLFEALPGFRTQFTRGGSDSLQPEQADSLTIGAVVNPDAIPNLQFSVDYFELEVNGTIGKLDPTVVCFDDRSNSTEHCSKIRRDPLSHNVVEVLQPFTNRGKLNSSGFDTQVSYQVDLPDYMSLVGTFADLSLDLVWTHLTENTIQESQLGATIDCKGAFGWPCNFTSEVATFPDDRITANAHYQAGELGVHLTWRWISGSTNAGPKGLEMLGRPQREFTIPSISDRNYVDLGIGYNFTDNIYAKINVSNLLDIAPPMMADAVYSNNTDAGLYDIFGRSYFFGISLQY